ncbi:MAG: hypothetical protein F6K17_12905 [Okeania sp. SIO3C4]|nr:hypothetical protein [Okeania sp. SIO3B3]NER03444.1 hypothetical protein [Okeania sp. SIO3C4]
MKFLVDMGISQRTVEWLRNQGYDIVHFAGKMPALHDFHHLHLTKGKDCETTRRFSKASRAI